MNKRQHLHWVGALLGLWVIGACTGARLFAQRLSERFGQPAVVDNKPGANGVVATQALASAPADGHTFMVTDGSTFSVNPVIYKNLSYDYKRDFVPVPVALAARASLYLAVHPKGGVANLQEFIALVKAKPGTLKYGLSGIGSTHHLTMEAMKSGQIKLLANNAAQRSSQEPQVLPTIAELIQALNTAGVDAVGAGPADYGRAIQSEIDRMAKAIAAAQIKSE